MHSAAEKRRTEAVQTLLIAKVVANTGHRRCTWSLRKDLSRRWWSFGGAKADIKAATNNGATPLHRAAANGHTEAVQARLAAKADLEAANDQKRAPRRWPLTVDTLVP